MPDYTLTIYAADDTTPIVEVGTAPTHARPWLVVSSYGSESTIDPQECSATIGELTVGVVDPQTGATQQDRGFTAFLPELVPGLRARLREVGGLILRDGVLGDIRLAGNDVTYELAVRDFRERQRKTPAFVTVDNLPPGAYHRSLMPAGVVGGYGRTYPSASPQLLPATEWTEGTFHAYADPNAHGGYIEGPFASETGVTTDAQVDALLDAAVSESQYDAAGSYTGDTYPRLLVRWRPVGASLWREVRDMPVYTGDEAALEQSTTAVLTPRDAFTRVPGERFKVRCNVSAADAATLLPADGERVEFQVWPAASPPTPAAPIYIEQNAGTLVRQILDGDFTDYPPQLPYDEAAVAAMEAEAPMVRLVVDGPVDDVKTWLEDTIFRPLGYLPTLTDDGALAPRRQRLPAAGEPVTALTTSNTVDEAGRWVLLANQALNRVTMAWRREGLTRGTRDVLARTIRYRYVTEQEQRRTHFIVAGAALAGSRELELSGEAFRSFTLAGVPGVGAMIGASVRAEVGERILRERAGELFDRFAYGGHECDVLALTSDPAVAALRPGDWVTITRAALPNLQTGTRGSNRLMQVVGRTPESPATVRLTLSDAGPDAQPLPLPTLGTITAGGADGLVVTVPVDAVPTNDATGQPARVVVQYAVSDTDPGTTSPLWRYAGDRTEVGAVVLPPVTEPGDVWVRARTEGAGRIASGWTPVQTAGASIAPAVAGVGVDVDGETGDAEVRWTPNATAAGVLVTWRRYTGSVPADWPGVVDGSRDLSAPAGAAALALGLAAGESVVVAVEPWTGYDPELGVAGTGGVTVEASATRTLPVDPDAVILPTVEEVAAAGDVQGDLYIVVRNDPQARVEAVEFTPTSGRTVGAPVMDTTAPFSGSVQLAEGLPSSIAYRVVGRNTDGATGQTLMQGVVSFPKSGRPAAPKLSASVDGLGAVRVDVTGDEQTASIGLTYNETPGGAVQGPVYINGRSATFDPLAGVSLELGEGAILAATAYSAADGGGLASELTAARVERPNKVTPKELLVSCIEWQPSSNGAFYARDNWRYRILTADSRAWLPVRLPVGVQLTDVLVEVDILSGTVGNVKLEVHRDDGFPILTQSGYKTGLNLLQINGMAENVVSGRTYSLAVKANTGEVRIARTYLYYTANRLDQTL